MYESSHIGMLGGRNGVEVRRKSFVIAVLGETIFGISEIPLSCGLKDNFCGAHGTGLS